MIVQNEIDKSSLVNMKLHEQIRIKDHILIVRVIGGWLYSVHYNRTSTTTFVPYTGE